MKTKKIVILLLATVLLVGVAIGVTLNASAASTVTEADWLAAPAKDLVKCPGAGCDHTTCDYVYSFAIIGDTQNLNIYDVNNDTEHMKGLSNWLLENQSDKNIVYAMGIGDITQAYYSGYQNGVWTSEWENAEVALSLLNGKLDYSLVRGNHDITAGFNGSFGKVSDSEKAYYYEELEALASVNDEKGRPMAGFLNADKIEDTYRKIVVDGHKYIIFTLDWHPTEECLVWLDRILGENADYQAIITLHSFITRDGTITDDYEDTFPYENLTGSRPNWEEVSSSGGNVAPKVLWQSVLSKHKNVKMIFSGHIDEDNIITTQLKGAEGNTVTAMLIDGQTIDSTVEPVGLVAMLYFSADGKVVNVEYISTVRANSDRPAYLRAENQFEVKLDYTVSADDCGWTDTPHGSIRTDIYTKYPFHILMDDDSDESTDAFYFGSYASWQETLKAIHDFAGNTRPSSHKKMKTYYIVMAEDHTDNYSGIHDNRAGNNFGKTVLDLNGKTLTLTTNSSATFLPFYVNSNGKYPRFGITNGNINIEENIKFIVAQAGQSTQGQTGTLELTDLNITYIPKEENGTFQPLISWYPGSGTGSNYDLVVENCEIDYSAISGAHTLFNFQDENNNSHFDAKIIGGSIAGSTAANTTLFATNSIYDSITFLKNSEDKYTSLTLKDSGTVSGVFFTDVENRYVEFGSPAEKDGAYEYSFVDSDYEITDYGMIDTATYPVSSYPFALFKGGEMIHAFSDWYKFIGTEIGKNSEFLSGCTLLLRDDYSTSSATGNSAHLVKINDLTIDLGGHTLSRGSKHLFQAAGTNIGAKSTKIRVINGTLASVTAPIIAFNDWDSSAGVKNFEFIFDGITLDVSKGQGIAVCYKDGVIGCNSSIVLNDCTIKRGSSTKALTLFALDDAFNTTTNLEKNIDDIHVFINGGKLEADSLENFVLATYDPERDTGAGSPDTVTLGKGSDGNYFKVELPSAYTLPEQTYTLTAGDHYLVEDSVSGSGVLYVFENAKTVYGNISKEYLSTQAFPFAVFVPDGSNYVFKQSYATFKEAIAAVKTIAPNAGDEVYIAMRRNYESTGTETATIWDAKCRITVDLGNYVLSSTATKRILDIHVDYTTQDVSYKSAIVFQNGTVKNSRTSSNGALITLGHAGTGATVKEFEFTFNNVVLAPNTNAIIQSWNHDSTTGLKVDVNLNNCTVDFSGAASGKALFAFAGDQPYTKVNMTFDGCDVIASSLSSYSLYTKGTEDNVIFVPDGNGVYLTVTQTGDAVPTLSDYSTSDGKSAAFALASSTDGKYVYELAAVDDDVEPDDPSGSTPEEDLSIATPYGNIPAEYADASAYPVIIFKNGEYLGNSTTIYSGAYTGIALAELKASADNTIAILLRQDLTEALGGSIGTYEMKGKLIIDLGGNTYTATTKSLFSFIGKTYNSSSNPNNPKIEVKNGRLDTIRLIQIGNQSNSLGNQYDVTFSGVTFGFTGSYWGSFVTMNVGASYKGYALTNLTFDDCIFDLRTGEKSSSTYILFDLAKDSDNQATDVVIKGGEIIFGNNVITFATLNSGYSDNTGFQTGANDSDTVKFEKGTDGYTVFTLPSGSAAPTEVYDSTDLTFAKISDNGTDAKYRLVQKAAAEQNFVPRASITLGSELVFNIYVPKHANLTALELDGEVLNISELTEKDGYYHLTVDLAAKTAARDISLVATLTADGKTMRGIFTFSIPKYAEQILGDGAIGDTEKTLVKDVLAYIRAAYAYFGTNDTSAIGKINSMIGEDYSNKPTIEGSNTAETTGLKSATFVLDGKPSMRFYLADGAYASDYVFYIGGTRVNTVTSPDGKYIDIDVYAYALCETVTYTVKGANAGSFHINAYYTYVSGDKYTEDDKEELVALTECFWRYLQSARDYKSSLAN